MESSASENANNNNKETLYVTELDLMVKDFLSQKSGNSKQVVQIHCDSPEEFSEMLWDTIQPFIEKLIILTSGAMIS